MEGSVHTAGSDHTNKGPVFLAIAIVFTILASLLTIIRVYVRISINRAFGWDDATIIVSTVLAIVSTSFNIPEVLVGYGQHLYNLSEGERIETLKWNYLATPLLVFSLAASKISICLLLLRLLDQTKTSFKRSFPYAIIVLLTIVAIPSAGYTLGQCQPVRKLWNSTTPGHCQDPRVFVKIGYLNGAINAFSDFALAIFPLSFIKDLHLQTRRKVILGLLMCCGVVCGVLAIARTVLTGDLTARSDITCKFAGNDSRDYVKQWYADESVNSSLFALIEENVSIIVACVPTLGPIFRFFDLKLKSLRSNHYHIKSEDLRSRRVQRDGMVPLDDVSRPPRAAVTYEASARPATLDKYASLKEDYGSETDLVPGIQKTTRVEVQSSQC